MTALTLTHPPHDPPEPPPRFRFRALRWLAARLPCREILNEGEPYLERYYLAGPIGESTAKLWPDHDRPKPRLTWLRRVWYLHCFHAPDRDRELHDHPWPFRGRVLAGAYAYAQRDSARLPSGGLLVGPLDRGTVCEGECTAMPLGRYHRITHLLLSYSADPPEVWTLLRTGHFPRGWGYLVGMEHVPSQEYHDRPRAALLHQSAHRRTSALIAASIERAKNV